MARWLSMAGLGVVLAAAAVLSFAALRDLALAVRIAEQLAWLLPICVDAGAAVACAVWLSRRVPRDARRFACGLTWSLLTLTVVANAGQLGMHAHGITPPWWVAVLVGAVPPAVVGGVVHLLVLVGRGDEVEPPTVEADPVEDVDEPAEELPPVDERGLSLLWRTAPPAPAPAAPTYVAPTPPPAPVTRPAPAGDVDHDRAAELIAQGRGRVELQRELGCSEHRAKRLIREHRNGRVVAS